MPTKTFTSGHLRKANWDPASRQLDIHWDNKSVLACASVVMRDTTRFGAQRFAYAEFFPDLRAATKPCPGRVNRYFCRRLLGLSGMVISIKPAVSAGSR